jgi:hypothetical protein
MNPTDWLPTYPDRPPRPARRRGQAFAQPPYNPAIFPVPDVLAGLTFLPRYPDRVSHHHTTHEQTGVASAAVFVPAIASLAWLPTFPAWGGRTRLPRGAQQAYAGPPLGYQMVVAQSLAWQARYPDRVPHRRLPKPGGCCWAIDPSIPASAMPCVDLGLETFGSPALLAQAFTHPTLIEEGLGAPALIDEDLCS